MGKRLTHKEDILEKINPDIQKDMETIWFTADLHHGHAKIIQICGRPITLSNTQLAQFKEEERNLQNYEYKKQLNIVHNNWLTNEVINKWVQRKDTIYFVGDFSMAKRVDAERFADRLNGNKFLILGNHDKNIHNSTRFTQITIRKDFTYSRFGINIHIVLDHYPLTSWNRKIHGSWSLYGHVHGRLKNSGLSFDVGIDNPELHAITGGYYRPLNLFEIVKIMEEKKKMIDNNQNFNFE